MKTAIILILTSAAFLECRLQGAELPNDGKLLRQPTEAVSNIVHEGRTYLPDETVELTRKILSQTDNERKISWLRKIMPFTTNLQSQLPELVAAFHREHDDDVKRSILAAVNYTANPRVLELCNAVTFTNQVGLRIFAGGILVGAKHITGLELSSRGMENFSREDQRRASINVTSAVRIFGLPFAFDRTKLPAGLDKRAGDQALTVQWLEWWAANKSQYLTNSPIKAP